MRTIKVQVRRVGVVSSRPFEEIVRTTIGHPEMNAFHKAVAAAKTVADLEALAVAKDLDAKIESLLETAAR